MTRAGAFAILVENRIVGKSASIAFGTKSDPSLQIKEQIKMVN